MHKIIWNIQFNNVKGMPTEIEKILEIFNETNGIIVPAEKTNNLDIVDIRLYNSLIQKDKHT